MSIHQDFAKPQTSTEIRNARLSEKAENYMYSLRKKERKNYISIKRNPIGECDCSVCKKIEEKEIIKNELNEDKHAKLSKNPQVSPATKIKHSRPGRPRLKEITPTIIKDLIEEYEKKEIKENDFEKFIAMLNPQNPIKCTCALVGLANLFHREDISLRKIDALISDSEILPKIIRLLGNSNHLVHFPYYACIIMINLTSISQQISEKLAENQGVPLLINLINMEIPPLCEAAIWTIGNMATLGSTAKFDLLLREKALRKILAVFSNLEETPEKEIAPFSRICLWALSNLMKMRPRPRQELLQSLYKIFRSVLLKYKDACLLNDDLVAERLSDLVFIAESKEEFLSIFLNDEQLLDVFLEFLHVDKYSTTIIIYVLRIFGNITTGSEIQMRGLFKKGLLKGLIYYATHPSEIIRKITCWTISNLLVLQEFKTQLIINHRSFIDNLKNMVQFDTEEVRQQAVWTLGNLARNCKKKHLDFLVNEGLFSCYSKILNEILPEEILEFTLNSLEEIFIKGSKVKSHGRFINPYISKFLQETCAIEKLKAILNDHDNKISPIADRVLNTYLLKAQI